MLKREQKSLEALHSVGVQLAAATDLAKLRELLLASIIRLTGARRAGVVEAKMPEGGWASAALRTADEAVTGGQFSEEDRSLVSESLETGRSAFRAHPSSDETEHLVSSYSALAVPLKTRNQIAGALYAESGVGGFDGPDLRILEALALLAAPSIDALRLQEARADEDEEIGEYISLVTHQMRIPLTSITGYTDLLLSKMAGALSDQQMDFLARIKRNVDRMNVLVSDLSDINRLESGRMKLEFGTFDLNETVSSVVFNLREVIEARRQELSVEVSAGVTEVCADRSGVRRVLKILLDNASRYTPLGGRILVRVEQEGQFARTEVADKGVGISEDEQANLFTPFFRSEDSAVREHVGWGLGLVLAKRLTEAQGGEITWTSEPGDGSTFAFTVPLAGEMSD